ncbi:hypothetical protein BSZ39_05100 [Bowdeniella nasicola]|uniref:Endonuclease/exonuclease/phosphatase domain-containing protein n=1 Tax=Bowdeniella nasicola TaxID=208480 RepID=A0A1Q5Q391_9ACTO|nr:endonuclease/exonuclease/phosphatase family protein [Bowdeniella nasicola]OKL54276.1 hypothetical protein BSZ39_05100 [Bowdeniella nasicola]
MRIGTWNIQGGRGARGGDWHETPVSVASLEALAEAIAAFDLDVIALQEVNRGQRRCGDTDQCAIIARVLGAREQDANFVPFHVGQADGLHGPPLRFFSASPGYGLALISRLPVISWHALGFPLRLPRVKLSSSGGSFLKRLRVYDTTRSFLAATIRDGEDTWAIGAFHAPADEEIATQHQITATHAMRTLPGTRLLAGDFNVGPEVVCKTLPGTGLVTQATFPNPKPAHCIDHLIADGPVDVHDSGVAEMPFSDHCLVWADISPRRAGS